MWKEKVTKLKGWLSVGGAVLTGGLCLTPATAQENLPFPPTPSASKAAPRLQDATHKRRVEPERLAKDAPNILIILIDDCGFGTADTFGGFAHTRR